MVSLNVSWDVVMIEIIPLCPFEQGYFCSKFLLYKKILVLSYSSYFRKSRVHCTK